MKKHIKRMAAPDSWAIARKTSHWVSKPSPGPHKTDQSMPLAMVVRDMLKLCDNAREARFIIGSRTVSVDGKIVTDAKYPVGLMDVVTIQKTNKSYRMLIDYKAKLQLVSVEDSEKGWKLARIDNKKVVKKGQVQLNLHDGRCIQLPKDQYKTGDVLKLEVPSQKIMKAFKLEKGSVALLTGGSHPGTLQTVEGYKISRGSSANIVSFKEGLTTVKENVFVVGDKTPEIKLLEAKAA